MLSSSSLFSEVCSNSGKLAKCQGACHPQVGMEFVDPSQPQSSWPMQGAHLFSVPVLQQGAACSGQELIPGPREFCGAGQGPLGPGSPRGHLLWRSCHLPWAPQQEAECRPPVPGPTASQFPSLTTKFCSLALTRVFPQSLSVPRVPIGLLRINCVMPPKQEATFVSSLALSPRSHEVTGSERPGC